MMNNPNLPTERSRFVIMSGENQTFIDEVEKLGINVIKCVESEELPYKERYHTDMQVHNCGYDTFFLRNSCSILKNKIREIHSNAKVQIIEKQTNNKYPNNILLNGAFTGDYYICKKVHSDKNLLLWYINNGIKIIDVNQGYARCSTAIISNNAIITDDEAIYQACKNYNNIDVLKISKGSIKLNGYNYGFIGGCCFKADKSSLIFFGNPKLHTDYENIKAFCRNYNVELIAINSGILTDIGGVVTII